MKARAKQMIFWIGILVCAVALFGFVNSQRRATVCTQSKIEILGEKDIHFVTEKDVYDLLYSKGFRIKDRKAKDINLMAIETELNRHPAVKEAQVFYDAKGILVLRIEQHNPLLRIINNKGDSYYLDEKGEFMPLSDRFTARVPIASGSINESIHTHSIAEILANDSLSKASLLDDLFIIAEAARKDSFIWSQMEQLHVLPDGDIEFIPVIGPGKILLGDAQNINDKFSRLRLFYRQALPRAGWNAYTALNLKYNKQIICTQNTN
jgi:cell division protein FtsQ